MNVYIPITPGGSVLRNLESKTEEKAWEKLLRAATHTPDQDKDAFIKRGYRVIKIKK